MYINANQHGELRDYDGPWASTNRRNDTKLAVAASRAPVATQRATASTTPTRRFTQADIDRAVSTAVAAERERTLHVLIDHATDGRARSAAIMLYTDGSESAAAIIARLATIPSDAEFARQRKAKAQAKVDAGWKQVTSKLNQRMGF